LVKEYLNDSINIINEKDINKRYEYIYDRACDIMDEKFAKENYCDFQNDKCIRQRNVTSRKSAHDTMGCCYMVGYTKILNFPIDLGLCKFFENKKCKTKCLTCKLFTCRYLRKKGFRFDPNDIYILKAFLNKKQKNYLREAFFTEREVIINKLIELDNNLKF
jgi:hypothetical protein